MHIGHLTDAQLFGQAIIIEAGPAGQDLHTARIKKLQILQRYGTLAGNARAAIVEQDRCRSGAGSRLLLQRRICGCDRYAFIVQIQPVFVKLFCIRQEKKHIGLQYMSDK